MIDHNKDSTVVVFPDRDFLSEYSRVRKLNSTNEVVNEVPCLADKSHANVLGEVHTTSKTTVLRNQSTSDFLNRSASNDLPMNACNFNPSTTDGNHLTVQTTLSGQKDKCPVSAKFTPDIEKKYVHSVYDAIAPHFSSTRFAKWPKVAKFLDSLAPGSIILDAGCGNGKYLGFNPNCIFIGCDISSSLISICGSRGHEVLVADALNLPYRTGFGDAAISIAVLHHLSTEERRKKAIEELVRAVHKGGKILITVWAVEQEDRSLLTKWTPLTHRYMEQWVGTTSSFESSSSTASLESIQETMNDESIDQESPNKVSGEHEQVCLQEEPFPGVEVSTNERDTSIAQNGSEREQQEFFVPWHLPYHRAEVSGASASAIATGFAKKDDKKGAVVYKRYYHVFSEGELERRRGYVVGNC